MKFGQLILRNSIKIVATRCQILRLKCTKIDLVDRRGVIWKVGPLQTHFLDPPLNATESN